MTFLRIVIPLYLFCLSMIFSENRYPPSDQVRGHAFPDHALLTDQLHCHFRSATGCETRIALKRSSFVPKLIRTFSMIAVVVVAALAILALITQIGVLALQRTYPAQGKVIEVAGASLNIVDIGPRDAAGPPVVMIHGASSNLEIMRQPLGGRLAEKHRVILIDRPGHGWSTRARLADSTPAIQARMIDEALDKLGVSRAILVVHSWSGALGARIALDYPQRVAGLVMLAPVAYPWPGGVGWYNKAITTPVIGPLLAYTITLPLGLFWAGSGARDVFLPQIMPENFIKDTVRANSSPMPRTW